MFALLCAQNFGGYLKGFCYIYSSYSSSFPKPKTKKNTICHNQLLEG